MTGLLLVLAVLYEYAGITDRADWMILDSFTRWQVEQQAPEDIVIVDIDDASLQHLHPWPWPRELMAALLERLFQYPVRAVALDMVFPEVRSAEGDARLADVVARYGICIAQAFDLSDRARTIGMLSGGDPIDHDRDRVIQAAGYIGNYPALARKATCSGHITPLLDPDGLVRHVPGRIAYHDHVWPVLPAALLQDQETLPVRTVIPYRIDPHRWQAISAWQVLTGQVPDGLLKDAWVLVGSTALGLSDKVATPVHPWLSGVVIHAELLNALLRPREAWPAWGLHTVSWGYLLLLSAGVLWLLSRQKVRWSIVVSLAGMLLWLLVAYMLWFGRVFFPVSLPWAGILLLLLWLLPLEWWMTLRRHHQLTRLFSGYLAPQVVEQLLRSPAPEEALKPQKRIITVMFADIRGFTALSESVSTEVLARLTRAILSVLTEQVYRYNGTLDKYIGDAVMAFWNAPLPQPDHADLATACALAMVREIESWNATQRDTPVIHVHIAIHTGEAMVGDLGTPFRHAYTAIGRTVNMADRLLHQIDAEESHVRVSVQTARAWRTSFHDPKLSIWYGSPVSHSDAGAGEHDR